MTPISNITLPAAKPFRRKSRTILIGRLWPARTVEKPVTRPKIAMTTITAIRWERLSFRGAPRSTRQLHTDVRRQIDRNEPVSRVQIVLPALVDDDSKVATSQSAPVSDYSIDLVELEGRGIFRVVDTENEAG